MKNLRVYIDKDKHSTYEKLAKRGNDNIDNYPFETMKDLFMFAACLGAKNNSFDPIQSSKEIFNADVFDEKIDVPMLFALAYQKDPNLATLTDHKKVLELVQGYANAGIHYVFDEIISNPGKPLNNLIGKILE